MDTLIVPPPCEKVPEIIARMFPAIAPEAGKKDIDHTIVLAQMLILLCTIAKKNPISDMAFAALFKAMIDYDGVASEFGK